MQCSLLRWALQLYSNQLQQGCKIERGVPAHLSGFDHSGL